MNKIYQYSIIIPHYTKTNTLLLERAINSIPEKENIQILVVDNSPIKIDKKLFLERSNVEILFSDNTKGAGHARNVGLENAKGDWLLFLDADDFFVDNAFEIIEEYYNATDDIIFFKMTSVDSNTMERATRHKFYDAIIDEYFINKDEYKLRYSYASPCAKMVRTKLVKKNNIFFDEVPAGNDAIFVLKIGLAAENIHVDKRIVYCSTLLKGSITNTISLENIESRIDVSIRKNEILKQNGYKKSDSIMYFLIISLKKFGIKPFIRLFYKALISNNLFVGYDRWLKTVLNKNTSEFKKYKIKVEK